MGASESKQHPITSEEDGDWVVISIGTFTGEDPQVKCDDGIEMQAVVPTTVVPTTVVPTTVAPVQQDLVTVRLENGFICTTSEVTLSLFVRTSGIRVTHVLQKGVWAPLTPQHAQCPLPSRAAMMAAVHATLTPSGRAMILPRG